MKTRIDNRLSSKIRAGRILALIPLVLSSPSLAGTLETEAAALRTKCLANASSLASITLESSVSVERLDASGLSATPSGSSRATLAWIKGPKKLKWKDMASPPRAYAVDGAARKLETIAESGATALMESLTDCGDSGVVVQVC